MQSENQVNTPSIQFVTRSHNPPFIVRAVWWLFVGWWLSAFFIVLGYLFVGTLILLPIGIWFLHRIPQAQTLRARNTEFTSEFRDGATIFTESTKRQHPWYMRLLYLPVGLILGLVWLPLAWLFGVLIITFPLSIWMIDRAPGVITLQRH